MNDIHKIKLVEKKRKLANEDLHKSSEELDQEIFAQPNWMPNVDPGQDDKSYLIDFPMKPVGPSIPPPPLPTVEYWHEREDIEQDTFIVRGFQATEKKIQNMYEKLKKNSEARHDLLQSTLKMEESNKILLKETKTTFDKKLIKFQRAARAARNLWQSELESLRHSKDLLWRRFLDRDWENMNDEELAYWKYYITQTTMDTDGLNDNIDATAVVMAECDRWHDLLLKVEFIDKSPYLSEQMERDWQTNLRKKPWYLSVNACIKAMLEHDQRMLVRKQALVLRYLALHAASWNHQFNVYLWELKALADLFDKLVLQSSTDELKNQDKIEKLNSVLYTLCKRFQILRQIGPFPFDPMSLSADDINVIYNEFFVNSSEVTENMISSGLVFEDSYIRDHITRTQYENTFEKAYQEQISSYKSFDYQEYYQELSDSLLSSDINPYNLLRELIIKAFYEEYHNAGELAHRNIDKDLLAKQYLTLDGLEHSTKSLDSPYFRDELKINIEDMIPTELESIKALHELKSSMNRLFEVPSWISDKFGNLDIYTNDIIAGAFAEKDTRMQSIQELLENAIGLITSENERNDIMDHVSKKTEVLDPYVEYDKRSFAFIRPDSLSETHSPLVVSQKPIQENTMAVQNYVRNKSFMNTAPVQWARSMNEETLRSLGLNFTTFKQPAFDAFLKDLEDPKKVFITFPSFFQAIDEDATSKMTKNDFRVNLLSLNQTAKSVSKIYYPAGYAPGDIKYEGGYDKYQYLFLVYAKFCFVKDELDEDMKRVQMRDMLAREEVKRIPRGVFGWFFHFLFMPVRFVKNVFFLPSPGSLTESYFKQWIFEDSYKPWKLWNIDHPNIKESSYWKNMGPERQQYWSTQMNDWQLDILLAKYRLRGKKYVDTDIESFKEALKQNKASK